jgi:hypothetical protein
LNIEQGLTIFDLGIYHKIKIFHQTSQIVSSIPCLSGLPADRYGKAGLFLNQDEITLWTDTN